MRRGTPIPTAVRALRIAAAVALAALVAQSLLGTRVDRLDDFFGSWVYDGVILASAVLCLLRAVLVRRDRVGWAFLAAGLLAWSAGEIHWTLAPDSAESTGPGLSDWLELSFYPASYAAIVLMVRGRLRGAAHACGSTASWPRSPPPASPPSSSSSR